MADWRASSNSLSAFARLMKMRFVTPHLECARRRQHNGHNRCGDVRVMCNRCEIASRSCEKNRHFRGKSNKSFLFRTFLERAARGTLLGLPRTGSRSMPPRACRPSLGSYLSRLLTTRRGGADGANLLATFFAASAFASFFPPSPIL